MLKTLAGALTPLAVSVPLFAALAIVPAAPVTPWVAVPPAATADPAALAQDYPDSASVRLRLLNRQLQADDRNGALHSLRWLAAHGHVFSPASQMALRELLAKWGKPEDGLIAAVPQAIEASTELGAVPAAAQLVETALGDSKTGRLFASTVVSRQLWTRSVKGAWSPIALAGADSLSGMVIDPRQRTLWVASGEIGMGQGPPGVFHGLIGIDLDSLRERRRIAAPSGVNPSDLALGCKGVVYASDPIGGAIYRAARGEWALSPLVAPGTFRSPQGLAESADCTLLYVSDYGYGLAAVRLGDRQVLRLGADPALPFPLDGIDGLWRQGKNLIAVQNGTSPRRILRLRLGAVPTWVAGGEVLEQAHGDWTEPLSGGISGGALIYVANGQWDHFEGGKPVSGNPPSPTRLRLLPLRTTKH